MLWIACALLTLGAALYALRPLFGKTSAENTSIFDAPAETEGDYLLARKAALYRNIKELEFERKMGRLDEADFRRLATAHKSEAVEILQKLDRWNERVPAAAARNAQASNAKSESEARANICPACGAKTIPGKKFCADCGARL